MRIGHRSAALALCALAGCSKIGDGANGSADAGGLPRPDAAAAILDAGAADASPIESLIVASDGSAVTTAAATDTGATYRLAASGVFRWGGCDATACPGGAACNYDRYGDAYYRSDDCWGTTTSGFSYISLYIDGEQVDWGAYSSDHVYSIDVAGTGAPLAFSVVDCDNCYVDNSGQLSVDLYLLR
jgi:hypothetical protein